MQGKLAPGLQPVSGYTLIRFLGAGGFGEVWEAHGPGGMRAALKRILLSGRQGKREFQALRLVKDVRHPHLLPLHGLWLKDGMGNVLDEKWFDAAEAKTNLNQMPPAQQPSELIVVMGLGDQNLLDRLQECQQQGLKSIPSDELFRYMEHAASGIDFLNAPRHNLGQGLVAIQHGDIKPQNILVVGDAAQVCDFGLARALAESDMRRSTSASVAYAPPEILTERGPSNSSDQYSLAISYFELATGGFPFDAESGLQGVIDSHRLGRLTFAALPATEQEVLRKATALDPAARFDSCKLMVQALQQAHAQATRPVMAVLRPASTPGTASSTAEVKDTRPVDNFGGVAFVPGRSSQSNLPQSHSPGTTVSNRNQDTLPLPAAQPLKPPPVQTHPSPLVSRTGPPVMDAIIASASPAPPRKPPEKPAPVPYAPHTGTPVVDPRRSDLPQQHHAKNHLLRMVGVGLFIFFTIVAIIMGCMMMTLGSS